MFFAHTLGLLLVLGCGLCLAGRLATLQQITTFHDPHLSELRSFPSGLADVCVCVRVLWFSVCALRDPTRT